MKLQIEFGQDVYDVDVDVVENHPAAPPPGYLPPLPRQARRSSRRKKAASEEDDRICRSPLQGLVARVLVEPGQKVETDQVIMVLEAMKMETNLRAPSACTVKTVHVAAGNGVQVGQALMEFE